MKKMPKKILFAKMYFEYPYGKSLKLSLYNVLKYPPSDRKIQIEIFCVWYALQVASVSR